MKTKIFLIAFFFASAITFSQNIAYVSQDSILSKVPNYKSNVEKLENLSKQYQEEIKTTSENLNKKADAILASYNVQKDETIEIVKKRMSASDISKIDLILEEDKFNSEKAKSYEGIIQTLYKNDIQTIFDKVNRVIEDYAKKNKIDTIFILEKLQPAIAYIDKKKNVTNAIIQNLSSLK